MLECLERPICDVCGSTETEVITKKEAIKVRNDVIEVCSNVRVCSECGNEIFDMELDEMNLSRAYDLYRKKHGIMAPEELTRLRERYGLSQRSLGKILGFGEVTIHRYETGAIPSPSNNKMLKLLRNPSVVKTLLEDSRDSIPQTMYDHAMKVVSKMISENENEKRMSYIQEAEMYEDLNIYSGYTQKDFRKLANVILFFAHHIKQLWKTKLNKLLFYSDFGYFKEYTVSLTGARYVRKQHGPVLEDMERIIAHMVSLGMIDIKEGQAWSYSGNTIVPKIMFDETAFSKRELDMLNRVLEKFGDVSSSELSERSHEEEAWLNTPQRELISYQHAKSLKYI